MRQSRSKLIHGNTHMVTHAVHMSNNRAIDRTLAAAT